jgi:hypothetical protein
MLSLNSYNIYSKWLFVIAKIVNPTTIYLNPIYDPNNSILVDL